MRRFVFVKPRLRPVLVATASVLLPGLGHAATGRRRAALLFLVPTILAILTVVAWAASKGAYGLAATFVTPGALSLLFAANIMVAGWRTSAAVDAVGATSPGRGAIVASALVVLVLVGVPHLIAADTILATEDFLDETFAGIDELDEEPPDDGTAIVETPMPDPTEPPEVTEPPAGESPGQSPGESSSPAASVGPSPSPTPVIPPYPRDGGNGTLPRFGAAIPWERPGVEPWGDDGRFDLLLIGSDAGTERWSRRNDVMLLVEVDVESGKVAMVGLPRNLMNAPYPPGPARDASACGCQKGLLNEMYVEATARNPGLWPGRGAVKGIGAVRSVVRTLTGRPIDAVLIVDLAGVIRVVDAIGGVDIDVPEAVVDDHYPDPGNGQIKLRIKAGMQHFDGHTALAYARSRHMDSDYGRMERQQNLILAIRGQLGPAMILNAPALFGAARGTAWTDLPRESLPALVELFGKAAGREGQAAPDRPAALPVVADRRVGQPDPRRRRRAPARDARPAAHLVPAAGRDAPARAAPTPRPTPSRRPSPVPRPRRPRRRPRIQRPSPRPTRRRA